MSGHSKWSTIKRKKGAADAARGKLFTRLAREIQVAARNGADPSTNFTLRLAVDRARAENMPKDNIERSIRRGAGLEKDGVEYENIVYEGYAPHGVAMLVECLTENRNRTISEVRRVFTRAGTSLGEPGSVAWQFTEKGYFVINRVDDNGAALKVDPDEVFMVALEAGADDVESDDEGHWIYCADSALGEVSAALEASLGESETAKLIWKPQNRTALDLDGAQKLMKLLDLLEDDDDVQSVTGNYDIPDDVAAEL